MAKFLTGIRLVLLSAATTLVLSAEETAPSLGLDYSITTGGSGELVWEIKDADGKIRDLSDDEKRRLLREKYFPEALAGAEAGKAPEVWIVGFFYLDGTVTEKDPGKAEEAFRRGLELGRPDGLLYLADHFYKEGMDKERAPEDRSRDFDHSGALTTELLEAGYEGAASLAISLASVHMFAWYGAEKDLDKAEKIHDNKYNYDRVNYINGRTKIDIICPDHGVFSQTPNAHLRGQGCPVCGKEKQSNSRRLTTQDFIERSKGVHGYTYDYSESIYEKENIPTEEPNVTAPDEWSPDFNLTIFGENIYDRK
jgi:hypothetical protein